MRISEAVVEPNLAFIGTHGKPEVVGIELLKSAKKQAIFGWEIEIANQLAYEYGVRQVKHNLAVAFGEAAINASSKDYELRRPNEMLKLAARRDIVLDIHDAPLGSRADFVEIAQQAEPGLLGIAALLGIKNVVIGTTKKTITGNNSRAMLIELGRGEHGELVEANVERLRECMGKIAVSDIPVVETSDFSYYQRITEIKTVKAEALRLPEIAFIEPFGAVPNEILHRLRGCDGASLPPGAYAVEYWNGQSSSDGEWFGSIFRRINNPFASQPSVGTTHLLRMAQWKASSSRKQKILV